MRRAPFTQPSARAERLSEYFDFSGADGADKGRQPVRRFELLALLNQLERARKARCWWRVLWRWLTQPLTWGAAQTPPATAGEIARGERV